MANPIIVIHGGAGVIRRENMSAEKEQAYRDTLKAALAVGCDILSNGGAALDAVTEAVRLMEDSPLFNAGKGSVYTHEEKHELEASIMDGKSLAAGSVAYVQHIKNPILAARQVMEHSPHVMLAGEGAEAFAQKMGLEIVPSEYFDDAYRHEQLVKSKAAQRQQLDHADDKHGTVGAVALDEQGNLAAATSTGGMTNKWAGRMGDTPIIGAGTYADNATCAISATGHGEYFMRALVSYDVGARMKYLQLPLEEAALQTLEHMGKMGGTGGLIAVDGEGNFTLPFNTEGMFRGYMKNESDWQVDIYHDE